MRTMFSLITRDRWKRERKPTFEYWASLVKQVKPHGSAKRSRRKPLSETEVGRMRRGANLAAGLLMFAVLVSANDVGAANTVVSGSAYFPDGRGTNVGMVVSAANGQGVLAFRDPVFSGIGDHAYQGYGTVTSVSVSGNTATILADCMMPDPAASGSCTLTIIDSGPSLNGTTPSLDQAVFSWPAGGQCPTGCPPASLVMGDYNVRAA